MGVAAIRLPPNARALCLQNSASSETISQRKEYGQHGLAWSGKATGRDSVYATISMRMDFLVRTSCPRKIVSSCNAWFTM
jgi:hypothetical protein